VLNEREMGQGVVCGSEVGPGFVLRGSEVGQDVSYVEVKQGVK